MIDQTLESQFTELNSYRKPIVQRKALFFFFLLLGISVWSLKSFVDNTSWGVILAVSSGFFSIALIFNHSAADYKAEYAYQFKQTVVQQFIEEIDQRLIYTPDSKVELENFISSGVWSIWPDVLLSQDQVSGRLKFFFTLSQVKAEYKVISVIKGGKHEHWYSLFKGIILDVELPERSSSVTIIKTKSLFPFPSILPGIKAFEKEYEVIQSGNNEFSKHFKTYSSNPAEDVNILRPELISCLLKLQSFTRNKILISFTEGRAFFALSLKRKLFEPPLYRPINKQSLLQKEKKCLHLVMETIGHLG